MVPELQRRGLFRTAYTGTTLRDYHVLTASQPPPPDHQPSARRLIAAATECERSACANLNRLARRLGSRLGT